MSTYLFDFDGTLGDSMVYFTEGMIEILRSYQISYSEETIKIISPLGYRETAKYFINHFKLPMSEDELVHMMHETLYPAYQNKIQLKPGVKEYLQKLKKEGHSLNILSASPYRMLEAVLKRCGIFGLFDHIFSSEEFQMTKDDVRIYPAAAEKAGGTLEDSLFFDDNPRAVKTAVKAGIHTIAVYDASSDDNWEEIRNTANQYICSFEELL